jgi:hypothetical protein
MQIGTTPVSELSGSTPGDPLGERAVTVSNADGNVAVTFSPDAVEDGSRVQVFRYASDEWSQVDGATGPTPTVSLTESETVAPFAVDSDNDDDDNGDDGGTVTPPPDQDNGDDGENTDGGETEQTLEIISTGENEFEYEFVFEGSAEKSETDTMAADSDDAVESIGSDRVRITGSTGSNSGDAFTVTGEFVSGTITGGESNYRILLGGEDITDPVTEESGGEDPGESDTSILTILSTEDNEFEYEIVVDGTATKSKTGSVAADSDDTVESGDDGEVVISGSTGSNAGDAFEITGTVEEPRVIGVRSGFEVAVDGEPIDVTTSSEDSGTDTDSDESSDSDTSDEPSDATIGLTGDDSVLEILATSESQIAYEVVIEGSASKAETDSVAADSSDQIETRDDDVTIITGTTGDNAGDAFEISGEIRSISIEGSDVQIIFEEEDVTEEVL